MLVRDIMTRDVQLLAPDDTLLEAARRMRDDDIGSLPVAEGDRLVGYVTDRDIVVRGLAEGFSADALPDFDDPESLLLEHGRGIRIMREWLDDLIYYRGGACAVLTRACHK